MSGRRTKQLRRACRKLLGRVPFRASKRQHGEFRWFKNYFKRCGRLPEHTCVVAEVKAGE